VCIVDPKKNSLWRTFRNHIKSDDVHLNDSLNFQSDSKGRFNNEIIDMFLHRKYLFVSYHIETLSEAVKILKGEHCLSAIEKFKMDRALIFCRTKLDCDNLERYLIKQGGGK
jgi:ATP-dependent RNA helicase DDX1